MGGGQAGGIRPPGAGRPKGEETCMRRATRVLDLAFAMSRWSGGRREGHAGLGLGRCRVHPAKRDCLERFAGRRWGGCGGSHWAFGLGEY